MFSSQYLYWLHIYNSSNSSWEIQPAQCNFCCTLVSCFTQSNENTLVGLKIFPFVVQTEENRQFLFVVF